LATILVAVVLLLSQGVESKKKVMPWMCLERCGGNSSSIAANLQQIAKHRHLLTGVSFERYNLGNSSQLILNNFTSVGPTLQSLGLETYPMVSSWPYPPQFLQWMREVFNNPFPFIQAVVQELVANAFTGVNIDWEPTAGATPADAAAYADFLTTFSQSLHAVDKLLTVDVAGWNPLWDFKLLSASGADKLFDMSTYAANFTYFERALKRSTQEIAADKLGVGLMTTTDDTTPYTEPALKLRFDLIKKYGTVQEIDIWDMPIPDVFWPHIQDFVNS